jgi:hypothetical protein
LKKFGCLAIILFCVVSCSSTPYFVSLSNDDIGLERVKKIYGKGTYFYFYSQYVMTKEEINSDYKYFFEFVENEVKKEIICNDAHSIIKQSLSYYGENGYVSILIKCT